MYTLLAARGWLAEGKPVIADGIYLPAKLYTILIAQLFWAFGESFVVARLPSVIAGSFLVIAVFLWTRSVAGALPAWIAALFVALSPLSIQMAQYARWYTLHALLFWLVAAAVYRLAEGRRLTRSSGGLIAGAAGLSLLLAVHLQVTTLIGAVGIAFWLAAAVGLPWFLRQRTDRRRWWWWGAVGVLALLLAAGAGILVQAGVAGELLEQYRWTPLHAAARRNEFWFYHLNLIERYPTLWPIFPFAALIAVAAKPRPALFCLCIFAVSFAMISLGGMKHLRYIFFILPFLFVLWAIALAASFRLLRRWVVVATDTALSRGAPFLPRRSARRALIAAGLVFLILANGAPARTILKPFGLTLSADETSINWAPARVALEPWLSTADVILTPNDLHALYYLGGYDIAVNASRLSEFGSGLSLVGTLLPGEGGGEFSLDPRTGRPVISAPRSLELVFECYPDGLFIADDTTYRTSWAVNNDLANLIEARTIALDAPPGLHAFRWEQTPDHAGSGRAAEECRGLPGFYGGHGE